MVLDYQSPDDEADSRIGIDSGGEARLRNWRIEARRATRNGYDAYASVICYPLKRVVMVRG